MRTAGQRRSVGLAAIVAVLVALLAMVGCEVAPVDNGTGAGDTTTGGDGVGTPLGEDIVVAGKPGGRIALMIQGTRPAAPAPAAVWSVARSVAAPVELTVTGADGTVQGAIALTDARIALKEFKFKRPEAELQDTEDETENEDVKLRGPFIVDLLTDTVTPEIPSADLVAGTYTEIQVKIDRIESDDEDGAGTPLLDAADPMFGHSIYLEGTYTGLLGATSVTAVPFVMSFDLDEEMTLSTSDPTLGFVVNEDMLQTVILAFRVAQWFDFSDPQVNPDGTDFASLADTTAVTLDENAAEAASTVREVIKHKIEGSADYGKDSDGDHRLDSDEDDDPQAADVEDGTGSDGEDHEGEAVEGDGGSSGQGDDTTTVDDGSDTEEEDPSEA